MQVEYRDKSLRLSPSCSGVLYAIAKARGAIVHAEALLNRVSDSENINVLYVHVTRLKKCLPEVPFELVWGQGYRWTGERPQIAEAA